MKQNLRFNPYSTKNALFISLILCLFQYIVIITTSMLNFDAVNRSIIPKGSMFYDIIISYTGNVIMLFIMFKFSFWIARKEIEPYKKHLFTLTGLLILTILLSLLFSSLFDLVLSNPRMYLEYVFYKKLVQDIFFALIVFLITISINVIIKSQKADSENIRNRYEALKNQLDPHFLFNSLNTLDGLIGFDDQTAHNYLQNLSSVFRNAIKNKEITELNEELGYLESYIYLLKVRYGENLIINQRIDKKYDQYLLLYLTLQLLIENAVKHNTINGKYPLCISIETTEADTVKIMNNKSPKQEDEFADRGGLSNLNERYMLMFGKGIKITDNNDYFSVEIPLIEQVKEITLHSLKS